MLMFSVIRETGLLVDELTHSKAKLHSRCLELFSELTEARTRIAELEGVASAMKYALTYAVDDSEELHPPAKTIDVEDCTMCATDFSDA